MLSVHVCARLGVCLEGAGGLCAYGGRGSGAVCAHRIACVCAVTPWQEAAAAREPQRIHPRDSPTFAPLGEQRAPCWQQVTAGRDLARAPRSPGAEERQEWDRAFPHLRVGFPVTVIENKGAARPFPV